MLKGENITTAPKHVQYSNENLSLHDDWKFHIFHHPIKNESSGTSASSKKPPLLKTY